MGAEFLTQQGYVMNKTVREKIIDFMARHPGVTVGFVATELGLRRRWVQDYLTKEVRAEIAARRAIEAEVTLADVDKAMMEQARAGNVAAARLVYMRMAQWGESGPLPSLEDMEAELTALKILERNKGIKESDNGAGFDDGIAVVDDAR